MQWLYDIWLEYRIELARRRFVRDGWLVDWNRFVDLIRKRSARQVARMERDKGLA